MFEDYIIPSLIDRLNDDEPNKQKENLLGYTLQEYQNSILRDLVDLLNTKAFPHKNISKDSELNESIFCYGIPDIQSLYREGSQDIGILTNAIKSCIETHETRILDVEVEYLNVNSKSKSITFRIHAQLDIDPHPVPIQVDTYFESATHRFHGGE